MLQVLTFGEFCESLSALSTMEKRPDEGRDEAQVLCRCGAVFPQGLRCVRNQIQLRSGGSSGGVRWNLVNVICLLDPNETPNIVLYDTEPISMHTYSYSKFLYILLAIIFIAQFLRESILSYILSLLGIWLYVYNGKGKRRKEILFPLLLVILVALCGCTLDFIATFNIYDEKVFSFRSFWFVVDGGDWGTKHNFLARISLLFRDWFHYHHYGNLCDLWRITEHSSRTCVANEFRHRHSLFRAFYRCMFRFFSFSFSTATNLAFLTFHYSSTQSR